MSEQELSLQPLKDKDKLSVVTDESTGKPLGLENYTPSTQFGYMKIDQETGKIEYTLTGEKKDSWKVVVTNFSFSRIMFEAGVFGGAPLCKSKTREQNKDNLQGVGVPGGPCAMCDYAEWKDGKRPPCNLNLNLSGLIEGSLVTPVGITCSGSNYKIGIQLLEWFRKNGISPWNVIMEVSTNGPFKSGAVSYYTYDFKQVGVTPEDLAQTLTAEYLNSGGMPIFSAADSVSEDIELPPEKKEPLSGDEMEDILIKGVDSTPDDKGGLEEPF